jgi:hypothetical protein
MRVSADPIVTPIFERTGLFQEAINQFARDVMTRITPKRARSLQNRTARSGRATLALRFAT